MKTTFLKLTTLACAALITSQAFSFCGFFVAKADASLFNEKSQVILARDGDFTVITMSNDYKGDLKEFAMVVPVPVVLKKEHIRIANQQIFNKLDAYSAPRVAEYHDANPCPTYNRYKYKKTASRSAAFGAATESTGKRFTKDKAEERNRTLGITIEDEYTVGEYDIVILSAKQSDGLKTWLKENGYKIPGTANEVLDPYIKNNLKFFVAKVNMENQAKQGYKTLRPIQFAYKSDKFMLPIRLGMANSTGNQDLIVYAFTRNGRVEAANYKTAKLPTDKELPTSIQNNFGEFYKDVYTTAWNKNDGKSVMLEYAWDLSSTNRIKCDPCVTPPLPYADLRESGVFWVKPFTNQWNNSGQYQGQLHITRLHVRYNREDYPQDILFTATPNKDRFQGRYVIRHAAGKSYTCAASNAYYQKVVDRRKREVNTLASLTGWETGQYKEYVDEYKDGDSDNFKVKWFKVDQFGFGGRASTAAGIAGVLLLLTGIVYYVKRKQA